MEAIIKVGSTQFIVHPGSSILAARPQIDEVLAVYDEAANPLSVSLSHLSPDQVKLENQGVVKGPKIRVSKFKAKSRYRKTTGHKSKFYRLKITDILPSVKKS